MKILHWVNYCKINAYQQGLIPSTPREIISSHYKPREDDEYPELTDYLERAFKSLTSKKIAYLITLTSKDALPIETHKEAFNKIKNYKKFKIYNIYGVIEYTKADIPHTHIYCEAQDYIRKERLIRLWKHGHIDIRRAFNSKGLDQYFSKDPRRINLN